MVASTFGFQAIGLELAALCACMVVCMYLSVDRAHLAESERHARAEAEQANRSKDEFLAVLSHELRTPLTAMLGWVKLLRAGRVSPQFEQDHSPTCARITRS